MSGLEVTAIIGLSTRNRCVLTGAGGNATAQLGACAGGEEPLLQTTRAHWLQLRRSPDAVPALSCSYQLTPSLSRQKGSLLSWGRKKEISEIIKPHKLCCKRETVSWNWTTAQVSSTCRYSKSRDVNPWLSKAWQTAEIISCLKIKQRYMVRSSANLTDIVVTKSIYSYQPRSCPLSIFTNNFFFSQWMLSVFHSAAFPLVRF